MSTDPASLREQAKRARVARNQQNHRRNKQEELQELRNKVRFYEQEGVTASQEVQEAAQRVDRENNRLRATLARVRTYLQQRNTPVHEIDALLSPISNAVPETPNDAVRRLSHSLRRRQPVYPPDHRLPPGLPPSNHPTTRPGYTMEMAGGQASHEMPVAGTNNPWNTPPVAYPLGHQASSMPGSISSQGRHIQPVQQYTIPTSAMDASSSIDAAVALQSLGSMAQLPAVHGPHPPAGFTPSPASSTGMAPPQQAYSYEFEFNPPLDGPVFTLPHHNNPQQTYDQLSLHSLPVSVQDNTPAQMGESSSSMALQMISDLTVTDHDREGVIGLSSSCPPRLSDGNVDCDAFEKALSQHSESVPPGSGM